MARAWITDRWTRDAIVDGVRVPPPAAQLKKLSTLEPRFRTDRFGQGQRWQLSWYERQNDGSEKLRRKSYTKRTDAEQARAALEDDIRVGRYTRPEDAAKPFSEAATAWIKSRQKAQPQSIDRYQHLLDTIVLPRWGSTPLERIMQTDIERWIADMRAGTHPVELKPYKSGKPRKVRPVAASRMKGIVSVVFGGVLRYAVGQRWLPTNPAEAVELPRVKKSEKSALTIPEVEAMADAAKVLGGDKTGERDYAIILTLGYSGVRVSELCALSVDNIEPATRRIKVRKNYATFTDGHTEEVDPKHYEIRDIEVPQFVMALIEPLIEGRNGDDKVFRSTIGGRLYPENVRARIITPAAQGAGLTVHVTPHTFRHTAASLAIAAGADVLVVQKMLGHKDATVTLNTYGHLFPDRLGEVAAALDKARAVAVSSSPNHPRALKTAPKPNMEEPPTSLVNTGK